MSLGPYLDLAVGARWDGAGRWCEREVMVRNVSVGAMGQNSATSVYLPHGVAARNYRSFRHLPAATVRHAGVARIDHALGRSLGFWIHDGGSPGGQVRYPFDALLLMIKIVAERHGAVVIGEVLGLAPGEFCKTMRGHGIYGHSVTQHDRDREQRFNLATHASKLVLSCLSSHGTPTVRGSETGRDLDWWATLGWVDGQEAVRAQAPRRKDVVDISERYRNDGFNAIVHTLLARSPSTMVGAQLDDVLAHEEVRKLPGTTDEHVNWRQRFGVAVEALAGDGRCRAIAEVMNRDRGTYRPQRAEGIAHDS